MCVCVCVFICYQSKIYLVNLDETQTRWKYKFIPTAWPAQLNWPTSANSSAISPHDYWLCPSSGPDSAQVCSEINPVTWAPFSRKLDVSDWLLQGLRLNWEEKMSKARCLYEWLKPAGTSRDRPSQWPINHSQQAAQRRLPNLVWHSETFPENNESSTGS